MGFFKKAEHFFEDHILHPGKGTKSDDWKGTDPLMAAEGIAEILMAPEITFGSVAEIAGKQLGRSVRKSLFGTTRKQLKRGSRRLKQGTRKTARSIGKAVRVPYKGKSRTNSAMRVKNQPMAHIPKSAKLLYESRYFEVYRDPENGKKYLWGKPTLGPKGIRKDPAGFAREWGENRLRWLTPKYRRSDPLEKDMAKIEQKYGNMDEISGYSRGGAAARYRKVNKNTKYRIFNAYAPYAGIGKVRNRRKKNFDFWHDALARPMTKFTSGDYYSPSRF
jgi:hypothetical protein